MYIADLSHFLDANGAIGPAKGPALAMAKFHGDVVAHATSQAGPAPVAPTCFKCKKSAVEAELARDQAVVWSCPRRSVEGRISNWKGTLWDISAPAASVG